MLKVLGLRRLRFERQARLWEPRLLIIGERWVPLLRSGRSLANGSIPLLSTFSPFFQRVLNRFTL
jgi:hypothetical protein